MRTPPATNDELLVILALAAAMAGLILYSQRPASPTPVVVAAPKADVVAGGQEAFGGRTPGWTSGRWLGEGDFKHVGQMEHPFHDQSRDQSRDNPFRQSQLPTANYGPLGPPRH